MTVDLHMHTTASDGTLTPSRVVRRAVRKGVRVIAITDHDTTSGLDEALEEAARWSLDIIPGIEINTDYGGTEAHILGYFIDPGTPALQEALARIQRSREERSSAILARLRENGIDVSETEVARHAKGASIGRPHVALALVDRKVVAHVGDAFDKWLARGRPAYVPRASLTPAEAIALIHTAGGIAVLAHPSYLGGEEAIAPLVASGLDGLEARYAQHDAAQTAMFVDMAQRYNLVVSGGSDFHGPKVKKKVDIGDARFTFADLRALCEQVGREVPRLARQRGIGGAA